MANKHMDPELECFDAETGKSNGFGELKGGMVFTVSCGLAGRLLGDGKKVRRAMASMGPVEDLAGNGKELLEELGKVVTFECAVGRNGKVWVDAEDVATVLLIGRCLQLVEGLTATEAREIVKREVAANL
jgi:exosome complex component RRP40